MFLQENIEKINPFKINYKDVEVGTQKMTINLNFSFNKRKKIYNNNKTKWIGTRALAIKMQIRKTLN